jgi:NAD dependent epimerase/dehydratase family enzyme
MVMGTGRGGIFQVLSRIARLGLGGPIAGGRQWVSWIHERDFTRAVELLVARDELTGPVNLAAPEPLPFRDFMAALRGAWGVPIGLPATRWMVELGAFFLRTDTELILKSRRVVPKRLLDAGFQFDFPSWPAAARELAGVSGPART